jgi:hypothetical protein
MSKPIWIVDDITVRPGKGPDFVQAYMSQYAPGAVQRGMTLANRMVDPALWLQDQPNRILFVWTVPDAAAVWNSKYAARQDPADCRVCRAWSPAWRNGHCRASTTAAT